MPNKPIYNPNIHHRKSIRLKGYDYSQAGLYFITICCQNRIYRFGQIENGAMQLNDAGKLIETEWLNLKIRFPNINLHEYVVMPNHFHAILEITVGATLVVAQNNITVAQNNNTVAQNNRQPPSVQLGQPHYVQLGQPQSIQTGQPQSIQTGQPQGIAPTGATNKTVGDILDAYKSITTVEYIRGVKTLGWQPFDGKLWQRNYHEHIIRNEQSFQRISDYIINNPAKWTDDKFYLLCATLAP